MRIVVVSDTHGDLWSLENVLNVQKNADAMIFLGDGERDVDEAAPFYPKIKIFSVSGNCDYGSITPAENEEIFQSKKIFFTHGHLYDVKYGYNRIIDEGRRRQADIVLFGHTHTAYTSYEDGIYIMNPGSVGHPNNGRASYGIIDITSAGIVTNLIEL